MYGVRTQARIDRAREGYDHGFVHLVQGVVHHRDSEILAGYARREAQAPGGQRVVYPGAGRAAAGHRVVHRHRLAGGRAQHHRQGSVCQHLVAGRRRGGERHRRGQVVVENREGVYGVRTQARIDRARQGYDHGLIRLVQSVVHHRDGEVLGRYTGCKAQAPGSQRVVHPAAGRAAAADRIVHRHRLAGGRAQHHGQVRGGRALVAGGENRRKRHRRCGFVVRGRFTCAGIRRVAGNRAGQGLRDVGVGMGPQSVVVEAPYIRLHIQRGDLHHAAKGKTSPDQCQRTGARALDWAFPDRNPHMCLFSRTDPRLSFAGAQTTQIARPLGSAGGRRDRFGVTTTDEPDDILYRLILIRFPTNDTHVVALMGWNPIAVVGCYDRSIFGFNA